MEFKTKQSIYLQIADQICDDILREDLIQGGRMQSVREKAAGIQVNPNTVMRSYAYLQDKGIIYNKRGIGYFIADDALQNIKDMKKDDFIKNKLPEFFNMMKLLGISFSELEKIYKKSYNGNSQHS